MAMDVLHHHDRVVDHEPDRQHHRQQRQKIEAESHHQHQRANADQRQWNGDDGNDHRTERRQEQEDHHDDDEYGLPQRLLDLVDRRLNEFGGIVGHLHLHRRRQVTLELRKQRTNALDQRQRVALRRRLHSDEDGVLAVEGNAGIGALGRQFDGGDVLDPHEAAVLGFDDHALELVEVAQVGVGGDVRDDEVALGLAGGGLEVVGGNRRRDIVRRHAAPGHLDRIEPQPHRKGLPTENVGRRHAVDGRQHRLHHAGEIVRYRRTRELLAGEAEIHHGGGLAGGLGDDRVVGFLGNQIFDRIHLGENFGQRLVGVEVQLDVDLDRAGPQHRRRGDIVDAFGRGDRLLDRRGDEALNQIRRRAWIGSRDVDDGIRQFRILADRHGGRRPEADQQDQQADDDRQNRTFDEDIS